MVNVKIRIESYPTTDIYTRYHGKAVDQALNNDWWISQPEKNIATTPDPLTHEQTLDLAPGSHTVEYAVSGYIPNYAWHAKIFVNGKLLAEGDVARDQHLKATFEVPYLPVAAAVPWLQIVAPAALGTVLYFYSIRR
jgi:hypothetical protein